MNIQDRIVKIIIVIQEAGVGLTRTQLQNILTGQATEELQSMELDQLESFGIAEGMDEEDWNSIMDRAIEVGLLKIKNQRSNTLTYTPEGKKFRKKPHAVTMGDNDEEENIQPNYSGIEDPELIAMMNSGMHSSAGSHIKSERSRRQIKLIHAIDRKIALDDFAESENIDLDEVLDDLEALLHNGKRMDITYFTDEVIGKEDIREVRESLPNGKCSIQFLEQEWGDVYNEEELRLLQYILS